MKRNERTAVPAAKSGKFPPEGYRGNAESHAKHDDGYNL